MKILIARREYGKIRQLRVRKKQLQRAKDAAESARMADPVVVEQVATELASEKIVSTCNTVLKSFGVAKDDAAAEETRGWVTGHADQLKAGLRSALTAASHTRQGQLQRQMDALLQPTVIDLASMHAAQKIFWCDPSRCGDESQAKPGAAVGHAIARFVA
jgi:hypothetical protein